MAWSCSWPLCLHDIADSKFHDGDEELGPHLAGQFLTQQAHPAQVVEHVQQIIRHMSFKGGNEIRTLRFAGNARCSGRRPFRCHRRYRNRPGVYIWWLQNIARWLIQPFHRI